MYFKKKLNLILSTTLLLFLNTYFVYSEIITKQKNNLTYSFFGETGETESVFTIGGRSFPIKVVQ